MRNRIKQEHQALAGKVVAITGAGRGIGRAIASALAARGARISIGDLDAPLAQEAAAALEGAIGLPLDVRDRASFSSFLNTTTRQLGPLDILINNAGIMPMGHFLDEDDALSDTQIDINLRGVMIGMKLALPAMLARGNGHIVNVASLAGRFPIPGAAVYSASKFAVVGLTESVREEYRGRGVEFTLVLPSRVSTDLVAGTAGGMGLPTATPDQVAEIVLTALLQKLPVVTAPRYLEQTPALYGLAPRWLQRGIRKLIRDDRILTQLDHQARAGYVERLDKLTGASKGNNQ